ncbi:MAG: hypothetical protein WCJ34_15435, partial [Alcaligenaceae bacterium]
RAHNPKVVGSNPAPATKYNWSIAFCARPVLFCVVRISFICFLDCDYSALQTTTAIANGQNTYTQVTVVLNL